MEMQQKKQRKHLTEEQKEVMITFMETHGDISTVAYNTLTGREKKRILLEELTHALNLCKWGVIRTPKEWMKSWSDNKTKTKSKAAAISRHFRETGGAPCDIPPLTPWEERIMGLGTIEIVQDDMIEVALGDVDVTETKPIIEVIEVDNMCKMSSAAVEPGPSEYSSEYQMTDPLSLQVIHQETKEETTSTPPTTSSNFKTSGTSKEKRSRKRRVRRNSEYDFEHFMKSFLASQKQSNSAILELASSIREGCRMIAESCNNIAIAQSQNHNKL